MVMTALGWLLIGVMLIVTGTALTFAWYYAAELDRVQRLHGRHVSGAAGVLLANRNAEALGFPVRVSLTPQEHADAMRELAGPYLPPVPAQAHVPVHARTVPRADAPGHPPWHTAGQGILTDAAVREIERQAARVEYVRSLLTEHGATAETMRDAIDGLRNWDPKPVQGEAPQDAVDEAQRLAAVMQQ